MMDGTNVPRRLCYRYLCYRSQKVVEKGGEQACFLGGDAACREHQV